MMDEYTMDSVSSGGELTRDDLLKRGAALGLALGGAGLLADEAIAQTPRRGGTLRVALVGGGSALDNLDPNAEGRSSGMSQAYRQLVYSKLTDQLPNGAYGYQLAESMTPNRDATVWQIKLKRGITWHDGSPLTVDDVIYTLQRILNPANNLGAARGNIEMMDPQGMRKINNLTMTVRLVRPWSDLRTAVGQRYVNIMKRGTTGSFTAANANGTGAFRLTEWRPGELYVYARNPNYFESEKPYLNGLRIVSIPDSVARVNALIGNQVDAIMDVPAAQVALLRQRNKQIVINPGGGWTPIQMNTQHALFRDVRVRQAMKHLMDREAAIKSALQGFGTLGNDMFARQDPLYNRRVAQRTFDPERAKSLLRQAGQANTEYTLYASDAVADMVPLALVFAQGARQANVKVNVTRVPADTFWTNTWGVQPFTFSSWGYRPLFAQWLQSFVSFNAEETKWADKHQQRASRLIYRAAATADEERRRALVFEAQKLHWLYGGYIIPYFKQTIDAAQPRVRGIQPHVFPNLSWFRFWNFWLA